MQARIPEPGSGAWDTQFLSSPALAGTLIAFKTPRKRRLARLVPNAGPGTLPQDPGIPGSAALEAPGPAAPADIPGHGREGARARQCSRLLSVRLGKSLIKFTCSIRAGDEAAHR